MKSQTLVSVFVLVGAAALNLGCQAHAKASMNAEAEAPVVFVGTPTLVAVGSGVWVVRDSERATYYVDDHYWVIREDTWYRSKSYDGGWAKVEASVVPTAVVSQNHAKYVKYQGEATAETKPAPRPGEALTSAEVKDDKHPHGGPPGQDPIPGVGNQRKADGEQPGNAHGIKNDPPGQDKADKSDKSDKPGADPPGAAKPPAKAPAKKTDKKGDKKSDKK